jgi:hypothetical protein
MFLALVLILSYVEGRRHIDTTYFVKFSMDHPVNREVLHLRKMRFLHHLTEQEV